MYIYWFCTDAEVGDVRDDIEDSEGDILFRRVVDVGEMEQ